MKTLNTGAVGEAGVKKLLILLGKVFLLFRKTSVISCNVLCF